MEKIIISACLCGVNCKYNGGNNLNEEIKKIYDEGKGILICPESFGKLEIPRAPREIVKGTGEDVLKGLSKVLSKDGKDSTKEFIIGAEKALEIAKKNKIIKAILKSKSPSCGLGKIYDGTFSGNLIEGNGVTADLFLKNNIKVYDENNFYEVNIDEL